MRTLTITAAEWASVQDGTLWLVREGWPEGYESVVSPVPPLGEDVVDCGCAMTEGLIVFGHAYAVGKPLPIVQFGSGHGTVGEYIVVVNAKVVRIKNDKFPVESKELTDRLAHYGPPESLVGKWAIELWVVGS